MAQNNVELLLTFEDGTRAKLEINQETKIPLNYNFFDIDEIASRTGNFSKTIKVLGTKHNNRVLGMLFDINATYDLFNPLQTIQAEVLVNTLPVINGFIQLLAIDKNATVTHEANRIEYEMVIFEKKVSFFDKISNLYLTDFDFGEIVLDKTSIRNNWGSWRKNVLAKSVVNEHKHLFFVPNDVEQDVNGLIINYSEIGVSLMVKAYMDRMFDRAGFTYTSTFFESSFFKQMIIPSLGPFTLSAAKIEQNRVNVGFKAGEVQELIGTKTEDGFSGSNNGRNPKVNWFKLQFPSKHGSVSNSTNTLNEVFTDDKTNYDNCTNSSSCGNAFAPMFDGIYDLAVDLNYTFSVKNTSPHRLERPDKASKEKPDTEIIFSLYKANKNGPANRTLLTSVSTSIHWSYKNLPKNLNKDGLFHDMTNLGSNGGKFSNTLSANNVLVKFTEHVYVEARVIYYSSFDKDGGGSADRPRSTQLRINFGNHIGGLSTFKATAAPTIIGGGDMNLNQAIPKDIKAIDFFMSITKMFNLVIEPDKNNPNNLIIEPFDEFFKTGEVIDWTEKKAWDRQDKIELMANIHEPNMLFTYSQAPDEETYNDIYRSATNKIYGQSEIINNISMKADKEEIEVIFTPTPNGRQITGIGGLDRFFVPIDIVRGRPIDGIKILMASTLVSQDLYSTGSLVFTGQTAISDTLLSKDIPVVLMDDRPDNPTATIQWGDAEVTYTPDTTRNGTDNTLTNRFYSNLLQYITEGKKFTTFINLNESDINQLNTANIIFIRDTYFRLNKIVDYDSTQNVLTKVELIKLETSPIISSLDASNPNTSSGTGPFGTFSPNVTTNLNNNIGIGTIGLNQSSISSPVVYRRSSGNVSTSDGLSSAMINSINTGVINAGNVTAINSRNRRMAQPDTIYLGDKQRVTNDIFVTDIDVIDGGINTVKPIAPIQPNQRVVDIYEGGEDAVRNLNYNFIEDMVDGGLDTVNPYDVDDLDKTLRAVPTSGDSSTMITPVE